MEMEGKWLIRKDFTRHSGGKADFKVEVDALTDGDIETFAYLIHKKFRFREVYGVPRGGLRIAAALKLYHELDLSLPLLIVDDVGTTGTSMETHRRDQVYINEEETEIFVGVVLFWVGDAAPPDWIHPVFTLW